MDDFSIIRLISEAALSTVLVYLIYIIVRSNNERDKHQEKTEDRFITMISNLLTQNRAIYTGFAARLDHNDEALAQLKTCYEEGRAALVGETVRMTAELKQHISKEHDALQQTIRTELLPVASELQKLREGLENMLSGNARQNNSIINTLDAINERLGAVLMMLQDDDTEGDNGHG